MKKLKELAKKAKEVSDGLRLLFEEELKAKLAVNNLAKDVLGDLWLQQIANLESKAEELEEVFFNVMTGGHHSPSHDVEEEIPF